MCENGGERRMGPESGVKGVIKNVKVGDKVCECRCEKVECESWGERLE